MSFFGLGFNGSGLASIPLETPNVRFTQQYTYSILTPPANLPVSLALVKEHLKLDPNDDSQDAYLTLLIETSRDFFQKFTNRTLINTGYRTFFNCFRQSFELARSKLQTLDSFTYLVDGSPVVVDPTTFQITNETDYSRIIFLEFDELPLNKDDQFQSITVDFTAGFGATDTAVPSDVKMALLNQIAALYENRGDCNNCDCTNLQNLPIATQNVYRQYKIVTAFGSPYRG